MRGTDTEIGKTVFSAGLTGALSAHYWKPVQSGLEEETDSEIVARLGTVPPEKILPEAYRLSLPASPHISARNEAVVIDPSRLALPDVDGPLVVELAGGLMVPLSDTLLTIDHVRDWTASDPNASVIMCARTRLGTINHSLLSIEALRARSIPILGLAFIGEAEPDVEATICAFGDVERLGRLGPVSPLSPENLRTAFEEAFDLSKFGVEG